MTGELAHTHRSIPAPRPQAPLWKEDRTVVLMILENHTDPVTGDIRAGHIADLANDLIGYCAQLRQVTGEI